MSNEVAQAFDIDKVFDESEIKDNSFIDISPGKYVAKICKLEYADNKATPTSAPCKSIKYTLSVETNIGIAYINENNKLLNSPFWLSKLFSLFKGVGMIDEEVNDQVQLPFKALIDKKDYLDTLPPVYINVERNIYEAKGKKNDFPGVRNYIYPSKQAETITVNNCAVEYVRPAPQAPVGGMGVPGALPQPPKDVTPF